MFMSREPSTKLSAVNSLAGKIIDSLEFARSGRELSGQIAIVEMSRLQDLVHESAGAVDVRVAGDLDEQGRPWLHLEIRGALSLLCQRCLGPMEHVLVADSHLRLIRSGDAWPEDELEEGSSVEVEDAIEAEESLDLMALVEEEIILDLPYAPMHEVCELPGEGKLDGKASPFAALAVLKKH